ncbi:uncharacterized protein PG998_002922 [Apiospora kogelbergensis]|uniref:uncharacterized protein n=1 Tax=Apiospora kogelbergensis TaxID=1337665 RepID=UPI0031300CB1
MAVLGQSTGLWCVRTSPQKHQRNWRSRKGMVHQNVFAAVRMDGTFSYVLAGAEGSMNVSTLLNHALAHGFTIPPNRFYLADAGFGRQEGIIQPYYGIRYHLQEWREGNRGPETAEELYNLRQSGSRIIVEQVIGMIKRKWKILRETAPEYGLRTQMRIVYAVCGLHNFIRRDGEEEVDEEADLPRWQRDQLEQARQRCERLEGMLPPEIREQIVRASWTAYLEEKRRRERRVD